MPLLKFIYFPLSVFHVGVSKCNPTFLPKVIQNFLRTSLDISDELKKYPRSVVSRNLLTSYENAYKMLDDERESKGYSTTGENRAISSFKSICLLDYIHMTQQ